MTSSAPPPRAGRREWIGLAVIALPCLLYSMDLTVLNLAVPQLSADLKPSSSQLLWIVDIYGFLIAGSLITMGTLGDRIGRRRLLLIGAAAFGAASVLAAFSTSAEMLIAARALLGIAGATLAPSTLSLIRSMFVDPAQRTVAIGVWVTSYSVGGAIGPLLGGILLEYFWWGSVFLLGVPIMVLLLVVGPVLLPEFRDPEAGRLDLLSAAQSLAAVLLVIYGLKKLAQDGMSWPPALSIVTGLAIGVLFVHRQRRLTHPLIDLRLFRDPAFSASLATYTLGTLVAFGVYIFIAQYLQLVLGLSPLQAGLATVPSMAAYVVGSMVVPAIARRVRPAYVMGARAGHFGRRLRPPDAGGPDLEPCSPHYRVHHLLSGRLSGRPPGDRPYRRQRTGRAGRGRVGHLGDQLRVRRGTRHRHLRQYRHSHLPSRNVGRGARQRPTRGNGGRAEHAWRGCGGRGATPSRTQCRAARDRSGGLHSSVPVDRGPQRRRCADYSPSSDGAATQGPGRLPARAAS